MNDPYTAIAERFARETEHHELTVLHDDGLYRHLKFKQPGNSAYWFDLITAWDEHAAEDGLDYDVSYEESARQALNDFEYAVEEHDSTFRFTDTWEWDLKDFDWWYLWACHAIVWGIAQYDTARRPVAAVSA
jgi:hypothetical protein